LKQKFFSVSSNKKTHGYGIDNNFDNQNQQQQQQSTQYRVVGKPQSQNKVMSSPQNYLFNSANSKAQLSTNSSNHYNQQQNYSQYDGYY
jgi:hypothetical protein